MVNFMLNHWLGGQQCSWKLYITYGASLCKRFSDYPRYRVEGRQRKVFVFWREKPWRQTAVPILYKYLHSWQVLWQGTAFLTLETGKRMIKAQSGGVFLAITTHYTNEVCREIILFMLFQLYDQSCIEPFENLCWYYYLYRALALLFPAPVPSLVWRPWWNLLGQSGAGTLPTPTPLETFFFFKISFSMLSFCIQARHSNELYCAWSHWNWGYDMNFFLLFPWFLGLFCILSHNAGVLPRCLFLPCSVFCRELLADWTPQEKQAKLWWIRYQWWVNCDIWRMST